MYYGIEDEGSKPLEPLSDPEIPGAKVQKVDFQNLRSSLGLPEKFEGDVPFEEVVVATPVERGSVSKEDFKARRAALGLPELAEDE